MLMQQAEKLLLDEHGLIPLYFYTRPLMVAKHVQGWQDNVMNYHPTRFLSVQR